MCLVMKVKIKTDGGSQKDHTRTTAKNIQCRLYYYYQQNLFYFATEEIVILPLFD